MSDKSYQAYEKMATCYEENNENDMAYNIYYERPGIISLLSDVENKSVLDIGCAAGFFSKWVLDNGGKVTAVDYSDAMVEKTKLLTENKADVFKADIKEPMTFLEDGSFDVVIASLVLHYVKDMATVLKELHKKMKKGGQLVLSVHHPFMDFALFECDDYFKTELLQDKWTKGGKTIEVEFYRRPLSELMNALCESGFVIQKVSEPMPDKRLKEISSKAYERLTTQPHFLFVKAIN